MILLSKKGPSPFTNTMPSRIKRRSLGAALVVIIGALSATLARAFNAPPPHRCATSSLSSQFARALVVSHCHSRPAQRPPAHPARDSYFTKRRGSYGELGAARSSSGGNLKRKRAVVGSRNAASLVNVDVETRDVGQPVAPSRRDGSIGSFPINGEEEDEDTGGEGRQEEGEEEKEQEGLQTEVSATNSRRKRKPPTYWHEIENVRKEISMFWANLGVTSNKVPNQTLLQYFGAHGLRHAFGNRGGCYDTAEWLGVEAIPGKWAEARLTEEIMRLKETGKLGPDKLVGPRNGATSLLASAHKEWPSQGALERGFLASAQKSIAARCSKNYWTDESNLRQELMAFNTEFQTEAGFPTVWMARLTDMNKSGRRDLVNAVQRTGGYDAAVDRFGMVHVTEWKSFLDQLTTLRELKEYLTVDGIVSKKMPTLEALKSEGKTRLKKGIVIMGGRKLVARKMGLIYKPGGVLGSLEKDGVNFGRFDLEFAVDLLEFVVQQEHSRSPVPKRKKRRSAKKGGGDAMSLRTQLGGREAAIMLPRKDILLAGDTRIAALVGQIEHFGGYENVARRLHLGYHYKDEAEYQGRIAGLLKERFENDLSLSDYYVQLQREAMTEQEQRLALRREIKDGVRLLQEQAERALLRRR